MSNKGGRPTKLNYEVQRRIVQYIEQGNYIETAAAMVGISKTTLHDWLRRGARETERLEKNSKCRMKKSEEKYVEFSHLVEKAQAKAEARDVILIGKAAESQWQAAAWRLERKFPDKWGRKNRIDIDTDSIDKLDEILSKIPSSF